MKKLVLLCDYGLDDAVATVYLLERKNLFSSIDILTVAGNSPADVSLRNAKKLLSNFEGDLSNVTIVDTCDFPQNSAQLPSIHGEDGMGDILSQRTLGIKIVSYSNYVKTELPADCVIASFGPCTVTKDLLNRFGARELLIMGGCVSEVPNFNEYEFNHYLDIPAFNECITYPHVAATLDSCRTPKFNYAAKKFGNDSLLSSLISKAIELAVLRHPDNCYIYDFIAAHYLVEPDLFITETVTDKENNVITQLKVKY